ncbi:endonuclease/exonuclease/phosphatase family protein [Teredinibacter haidensis]|uniref:endonuclease/exonuclease/phosphatase family protein n=1 Tax=Teredinibacter haidensis TaxID=2731755 RepID=UPI000948DF49|nr:endonuclease/exonuclease/phosphatase family protein [Teredinibacter haidensis]
MKFNRVIGFTFLGLLKIGCIFLFAFSFFPLLEGVPWYLDLLAHFRFQYLVLSVIFLITFIHFRKKMFVALSLSIFLVNAIFVTPGFVSDRVQKPETNGQKIRLFHSNVLTSNSDYSRLVNQLLLENPDIIVLQEVDKSWIKYLSRIKEQYKYFVEFPRQDNFGIALFSRIPISSQRIHYWGGFNLPSIEAEFMLGDVSFSIVATHPPPPVSAQYHEARNSQILSVANRVRAISNAKVVIGDLNTSIWSAHYRALELGTGLANANKGFGYIPTWPTKLAPMMISIDHCLVSEHFNVLNLKSGKNIGSDHLPLIVDLEL